MLHQSKENQTNSESNNQKSVENPTCGKYDVNISIRHINICTFTPKCNAAQCVVSCSMLLLQKRMKRVASASVAASAAGL